LLETEQPEDTVENSHVDSLCGAARPTGQAVFE